MRRAMVLPQEPACKSMRIHSWPSSIPIRWPACRSTASTRASPSVMAGWPYSQYRHAKTRLVCAQADAVSVVREAGVKDLAAQWNRFGHRDATSEHEKFRDQCCQPAALLGFQVRARFCLNDQKMTGAASPHPAGRTYLHGRDRLCRISLSPLCRAHFMNYPAMSRARARSSHS